MTDIRATLAALLSGSTLQESHAQALFHDLLSGSFDDAQIAALLALLQSRGPTADELTGAARTMRSHVTRVPVHTPQEPAQLALIDTCGTGGAAKTFNVSTAAAILAAAASPHHDGATLHVRVAKHGNRSRTGRGSAEVLAALGVNVDASPAQQARCLDAAGVCFCFAIHHHPAMRSAAGPRKSLGFPTIFNLLGPLTNPAGAERQLIGVYAPHLVPLVAAALARLGAHRAMVVHSADGLDELSTTAPTHIAHVSQGSVRTETIDAVELGLPRAAISDLTASDVAHAARMVRAALEGEPGPALDIVLLNAAAALVIAGAEPDLAAALVRARRAIASGRARAALDTLIRTSHEPA